MGIIMEELMSVPDFESPDIFLSYSHDDKEIVEKIATLLADAGFKCWIDSKNLRQNDEYSQEIGEAITKCVVFIAFLSKSYVNKTFCPWEFGCAQERGKSIIAFTLDDVNENTNKKAGYMFLYKAGRTNYGYGKTSTIADAQIIADELKRSYHLQKLQEYYRSGDENDLPKIKLPEMLFSQLELYNKKQYKQDGNYELSDIKGELFPAIKDIDNNAFYKDDENAVSSLVKYIDMGQEKGGRKNLFLFGDGGMGKTVTMLKTAEYLLSREIPSIYIPLSKIDKENTIEKYLRMNVCNGIEVSWKILRDTMSYCHKDSPSVVLLLDGVNELPADRDMAQSIISDIKNDFIDGYKGVDLIITSRWFDPHVLNSIENNVIKLEMQQLDRTCINQYLESIDIPAVSDEKMLSVLSTPLFLSLYADVEKHKDKYGYIEDIKLIENPDTPCKILQNFFQTQLFRAAGEKNFDRAAHYVLLEYMLPEIAYRMTRKKSRKMVLSLDDIFDIQDEIEDKCERYKWYSRDRLRKVLGGRSTVDAESLLTLAENSLHFLHKNEEGYSLHQSFRDYFAAYHIANEMSAFCKSIERVEEVSPVLEEACFDDYILKFVSDLVNEENAAPCKTGDGWILPAKNDPEISKAQKLLDLWRNKEGEKPQNAVYNLFSIMRIGRKSLLFGCDFSGLDFRKCVLGKNVFVEWENDNIYPSKFDEAWIDFSSFVIDGHDSAVTALCTDGKGTIFSGDENGVVKAFDSETHKCIRTMEFRDEAVTDIAWHSETKRLAIMYKNSIYIYSYENKSHEIIKNEGRNGDFRYVDFDEHGELTVSYSLEPLMIKYLSGERVSSIHPKFDFDVPARCARWNPQKTEFARSMLLQAISLASLSETGEWWIHPALKKNISDDSTITAGEQEAVRKAFMNSRQDKTVHCSRIFDPTHIVDNSYLISLGRSLYVYSVRRKKATHKKSFNCDISNIINSGGQITVELENVSVLLKPCLALNGAFLRLRNLGAKGNSGINSITYSEDGGRLLVGIQNQLIEFETEGLTVVRQKNFPANVGSTCYLKNRVIVSAGAKVYILNEDFSEKTVFQSGNTAEIKCYVEDWEGDGCYIVTTNGTVKKLSRDLVVQRIRRVGTNSKFLWAKETETGKTVLLFNKMNGYSHGAAVDFERGTICKPMWKYELMERFFYEVYENKYYIINNQLITYEKTPPFKKISFKNYSGINIHNCSFLNIKGDIAEPEGKNFIRQNGGIVNE